MKNIRVFILLLLALPAGAKTKIQLRGENVVSGSGTKGYYNTSAGFGIGRSGISAGASFAKSNFSFSGVEADYRFTFNPFENDRKKKTEFFIYASGSYSHETFLSKSQIKREERVFPENNFTCSEVKLRITEEYIGFGINRRIIGNLCGSASIAAGAYQTLNKHAQLYREDADVSVQVRVGIIYNFLNQKVIY